MSTPLLTAFYYACKPYLRPAHCKLLRIVPKLCSDLRNDCLKPLIKMDLLGKNEGERVAEPKKKVYIMIDFAGV